MCSFLSTLCCCELAYGPLPSFRSPHPHPPTPSLGTWYKEVVLCLSRAGEREEQGRVEPGHRPACSAPGRAPCSLLGCEPRLVPEGLLLAETVFCPVASLLPSCTVPRTLSLLNWNFLCRRLLWGRAVYVPSYCVLDTGNLGQVAASWVWAACWSAGLAGGPALAAGHDFQRVEKGARPPLRGSPCAWRGRGSTRILPTRLPPPGPLSCAVGDASSR